MTLFCEFRDLGDVAKIAVKDCESILNLMLCVLLSLASKNVKIKAAKIM